MLIYRNKWTERWCFRRGSRGNHGPTEKRGLSPPTGHARLHCLVLLTCSSPRTAWQDIPCSSSMGPLQLRGAAPLSSRCHSGQPRGEQRSHSRKYQWKCLYCAWEEIKRQWNTNVCKEQAYEQERNNMEEVGSSKVWVWFRQSAGRLVGYEGGDFKCFNKNGSQVHFTTAVFPFKKCPCH